MERADAIAAARLKKRRLEMGMAQEDVEKLTGLSREGLSNYERGVRAVPSVVLRMLCEVYGVSADWVLGLDARTPPPAGTRSIDWFLQSEIAEDLGVDEIEEYNLRALKMFSDDVGEWTPLQWARKVLDMRKPQRRSEE